MSDDCKSTHWTLESLKVYFEDKFVALDKLRKQEANTLAIQAKEYERRLEGLNHEAARINAAAQQSLSRDAWDTFLKGDSAWKSQSERDKSTHLPRAEYDVQNRALSERLSVDTERIVILEAQITSRRAGIGSVGALVLGTFVVISSLASVIALFISLRGR